jgi:TolA-binding protein
MKKLFTPLIWVLFLSCSSSSSSSAFEADVRKLAELGCRARKLAEKVLNGDDNARKEMEALEKQGRELGQQIDEKYQNHNENEEMKKKFEKITEDVIKQCN